MSTPRKGARTPKPQAEIPKAGRRKKQPRRFLAYFADQTVRTIKAATLRLR